MKKIERKVVKKYAQPQKRLYEQKKLGQTQRMEFFQGKENPNMQHLGLQRLILLHGPKAREYARAQMKLRVTSDIRSWKSVSACAKLIIARERCINEYLDDQRREFAKGFTEKYKIPFTPAILENMEFFASIGFKP